MRCYDLNRLEETGVPAMMPCSRCFERELFCVFCEGSDKCSECTRRGRTCDGSFSGLDFDRLETEKGRLEAELQASLARQAREAQQALSLSQRIANIPAQQVWIIAREATALEALDAEEASRSLQPNAEVSSSVSLGTGSMRH